MEDSRAAQCETPVLTQPYPATAFRCLQLDLRGGPTAVSPSATTKLPPALLTLARGGASDMETDHRALRELALPTHPWRTGGRKGVWGGRSRTWWWVRQGNKPLSWLWPGLYKPLGQLHPKGTCPAISWPTQGNARLAHLRRPASGHCRPSLDPASSVASRQGRGHGAEDCAFT